MHEVIENRNHTNHTNRIFYKNIFRSIDRLTVASNRTNAVNYFASLRYLFVRDAKCEGKKNLAASLPLTYLNNKEVVV